MSDEDSLVLRCRELNDVAGLVRGLLEPRMSKLAKDNLVYTFKNRLKSPGAILSKVRRKRTEANREAQSDSGGSKPYGPDNVTDVWGCRYVTLYQSQIPQTVKALLTNFDEYNSSFDRAIRMTEFVIYTNRPAKDPLSITNDTLSVLGTCEISSGVESKDSIRPPENRKSAYSSVHLLFAIDVDAEHPGKGTTRETGVFEVQVRDIFEEGWGEIQHHLIYSEKDRSASRADASDDVDPVWQQHLNALKTFVDGCSQHASIIKRTYDNIQERSMPSLETKSATNQPSDRDAILGALDGTAYEAVETVIKAGYELMIDATTTDSVEERKTNYAAAAAKFSEALERAPELDTLPVNDRAGTPVGYFLGMELANCLVFAGEEEGKAKALTLYESLVGTYPQDPMVRLRQAVALASNRSDDLATITRTREMIREAIPLIHADPLTGPEHWITISCYVHLGFLDWQASGLGRRRSKEAVAVDLREAISDTRAGYEFWSGLKSPKRENDTYVLYAHKALSNALYYAAQLKRLAPADPLTTREAIEAMIGELGRLQVPTYKEYYKTRDNIMTALDAIGNREGARHCARENITELRKRAETRAGRSLTSTEARSHLLDDELRNFQSAALVLADSDG